MSNVEGKDLRQVRQGRFGLHTGSHIGSNASDGNMSTYAQVLAGWQECKHPPTCPQLVCWTRLDSFRRRRLTFQSCRRRPLWPARGVRCWATGCRLEQNLAHWRLGCSELQNIVGRWREPGRGIMLTRLLSLAQASAVQLRHVMELVEDAVISRGARDFADFLHAFFRRQDVFEIETFVCLPGCPPERWPSFVRGWGQGLCLGCSQYCATPASIVGEMRVNAVETSPNRCPRLQG